MTFYVFIINEGKHKTLHWYIVDVKSVDYPTMDDPNQ